MFYSFVRTLKPKAVGFLMGAIQGLNFWLIFAIAYFALKAIDPLPQEVDRNRLCPCGSGKIFRLCHGAGLRQTIFNSYKYRLIASFACAAVGFYGPASIVELGTTSNDNLTALFVLGAILIVIRKAASYNAFSLTEYRNEIILAGLLLGLGTGFKLTLMIYSVGFTLALPLLLPNFKQRMIAVTLLLMSFAAGITISAGHWMLRMWTLFENPLFPFYNAVFRSPYFIFSNFRDTRYIPHGFLQNLFYPFYFFSSTDYTARLAQFRDIRFAMVYLLLLFLIFLLVKNSLARRTHEEKSTLLILPNTVTTFLFSFFILSYIAWQLQFSSIRYILPLELLAPLLVVIILTYLLNNLQLQKYDIVFALLLIILVMTPMRKYRLERLPWEESFFRVQTPEIEQPQNSIIIIAGESPWAYILPFFHPAVRIVRVVSVLDFTMPAHDTKLQQEMQYLLRNHNGPLYLLSRTNLLKNESAVLEAYDLKVSPGMTLPIRTAHEGKRRQLGLWKVEKIK